ncbi:DML1 [Candida pseudojiufengensis]|uniref:DML1 n=1 Tax=Candida pseudojiufengensis TaxID=497109 RepID=UPI00222488E1|nr:DML1 [Candida pseudojiufengensis]KAI5961638.1 DML1 [Candida pseudojiufengensis]
MNGEIFNLSYGQYSNNTLTHLYNYQESLIPYTKETKLTNDLNVFLYRSKQNDKSINYYPRAIIYELRGGLGSLNKYEYSENIPAYDMQIINKPTTTTKNEYQRNLDISGESNSNLLNTTNTKYWTDFNKLIYNPKSIITTPNYMHNYKDYGTHYNFPNLKFDIFENGVEEFRNCEFETEDNFRYWIEKCDFLQGLQINTSISDSWGGFTNSMIEFLQDEFFNNKGNFWIFGDIQTVSKQSTTKISEIKTFLECFKNSTLFFPLKLDLNSSILNLDKNSIWQTSCISSIFINSIWGLNNSIDDPINMSTLSNLITKDDENRKIINEIKIINDGNLGDIDYTTIDLNNFEPNINLGISTTTNNDTKYYSKNIITSNIDMDIDNTNIFNNPTITNILDVDTFPKVLKTKDFHTEFNVNSNLKNLLKENKKFIQRVRNLNIDVRDELIDDISNLISIYSSGFESEDEEFYD